MKGLWLALAVAAALASGSARAEDERTQLAPEAPAGLALATFAGGCFWCMEPPFDKLAGVVSTTSGYTGGRAPGATYKEVSRGGTGHTEAVRVVYDPGKVSYEELVDTFWKNVDPLDPEGQFCDQGDMYRPAIFTHDDKQKAIAEASKSAFAASGRFKDPIVVTVEPAREFWVAEDYHQDYYLKNPLTYAYYRWGCGRDARLEELWGKPGS
ncbi:MAG TPA: peptide-methionine (S)-S-oxide reductase MsrA [Beijerinckiaceae bacterium]|nr:peptide-methionine (S)-S-oxide reductase MsrA [Beijerinckiaceae bacterium]